MDEKFRARADPCGSNDWHGWMYIRIVRAGQSSSNSNRGEEREEEEENEERLWQGHGYGRTGGARSDTHAAQESPLLMYIVGERKTRTGWAISSWSFPMQAG